MAEARVGSPRAELAGDANRWPPAKRFAFRWLFSYVLLYALPFPLDLGGWLGEHYAALWTPLVTWVGKRFFAVDITILPNGSGDTTWNYVLVLCFVVLATAAAALWTLLDRQRGDYARLHDWLRAYVRLYLGLTLCSYGAFKVIQLQFPAPGLSRLVQPFGDSSPMGLLWTFMGSSAAYNAFTGGGELLGGLLLFARRTTLLGSLICIGVMSNVFMLNMSYDVPVKLFSLHLLALAVLLAAPDAQRLLDLFVFNRAVPPVELRPLLRNPRAHRLAVIGRTVLLAGLVSWTLVQAHKGLYEYGDLAPKPALYGIWTVDTTVDGVARPPLVADGERWRRVIFDRSRQIGIQLMNDSRVRYVGDWDEAKGLLLLAPRATPAAKVALHCVRPQPDRLEIDGVLDGHRVAAVLRLTDASQFLLLSRGFHWINEYPFNC